jgi:hypothetical protein
MQKRKYQRDEEKSKKIKFLSQYINLVREYEELVNSYNLFYTRLLHPCTPIISDMPKGSNFAAEKLSGDIAKLEKIKKVVEEKKRKLYTKYMLIEQVIDKAEDPIHRTLLRLRYISGKGWEQICIDVHYSWEHVHRLHRESLKSIDIKVFEKNKINCKNVTKRLKAQ